MRAAVIVLALMLAVAARASEDDDRLLETPPLGEAIPERMKTLENEWADDVGMRAPDEAAQEREPEDATQRAEPTEGDAEEPHPATIVPAIEEPARRKSPLERDRPTTGHGESTQSPDASPKAGRGERPTRPAVSDQAD